MSDLKPCPNPECGHPEPVINGYGQAGWEVECGSRSCGMAGPVGNTNDEAIRLWNLLPRVEGDRREMEGEE